jgi:hypothetical protein
LKANRSNCSGGNVYVHIIFEVFGDVSGGPVADAEVRLVAVDGIDGTCNQLHVARMAEGEGLHDRKIRRLRASSLSTLQALLNRYAHQHHGKPAANTAEELRAC